MTLKINDEELPLDVPDQVFFEPDEEKELTWWDYAQSISKIAIAGIAIIGMLFLSGIHQLLLFSRTPETLRQAPIEVILDAETITLPFVVFVVRNEEVFGSARTIENARNLISNADIIWDQANIDFEVRQVVDLTMNDADVQALLEHPQDVLSQIPQYSYDVINVFLLSSLRGINGLALVGHNTIFVADYTTVIDFRTYAHEVGHILGLGHVPGDRGRLMFRGANGFVLTSEEIMTAREQSVRFTPVVN